MCVCVNPHPPSVLQGHGYARGGKCGSAYVCVEFQNQEHTYRMVTGLYFPFTPRSTP
jgi:hypothetical protein